MLSDWKSSLAHLPLHHRLGRVTRVTELVVEAEGPDVALGDVCQLQVPDRGAVQAEVIALNGTRVTLMPYAPCRGLVIGMDVRALDAQPHVKVGAGLLGQVVDGFGQPLLGPMPGSTTTQALYPAPLSPLDRLPVTTRLETGIRAIDALLPLGRGQRMGIFAGSGVGKSSLLGMLARSLHADVSVIALIGERGREVQEFVDKRLSAEARARTVIVAATAEQPAVVRARAAHTAMSIAEFFRSQGKDVMLLMDSITRFALARREIDLAAGQPPAARGFTPSVFSAIPALCERCGALRQQGAITGLFTVLVEGDDMNEPIADTLRATLDGHIVLSRELANAGHHPAIDVLGSVSRLDTDLLPADEQAAARQVRSLLATHARHRDMVDMGLYKAGSNPTLDLALQHLDRIHAFLRQATSDASRLPETQAGLMRALHKELPT